MNYNVIATVRFEKEIKKLIKKYPSLKNEYSLLIELLQRNPSEGIGIGHSCYKIRVAISSKGKGKSGGARVITFTYIVKRTVYLLTIYDKSDIDTISDQELLNILKEI